MDFFILSKYIMEDKKALLDELRLDEADLQQIILTHSELRENLMRGFKSSIATNQGKLDEINAKIARETDSTKKNILIAKLAHTQHVHASLTSSLALHEALEKSSLQGVKKELSEVQAKIATLTATGGARKKRASKPKAPKRKSSKKAQKGGAKRKSSKKAKKSSSKAKKTKKSTK